MANRKIDTLLSPHPHRPSVLARLLGHAARQDAWTAQLRALLPQELVSECRIGNVRDHVLTVHTNNAAWATRLRFLLPALLQSLNRLADFAAVTEIRLKVVAFVPDTPPTIQSVSAVRPPERGSLPEPAGTVDSDGLQNALLRLAPHAETRRTAHDASPQSAEDRSRD